VRPDPADVVARDAPGEDRYPSRLLTRDFRLGMDCLSSTSAHLLETIVIGQFGLQLMPEVIRRSWFNRFLHSYAVTKLKCRHGHSEFSVVNSGCQHKDIGKKSGGGANIRNNARACRRRAWQRAPAAMAALDPDKTVRYPSVPRRGSPAAALPTRMARMMQGRDSKEQSV